LPSQLLDDPDYFDLAGDTQSVLIGLVLCADDHGRCFAHLNWLARKLNREERVIEAALATLEAYHLIQRYQVEQQHYCLLLKWWQWQSLHNPARPLYPEPSQQGEEIDQASSPSFSEKVRESSRDSENLGKSSLEVEEEVEEEIESESEREEEDEEERHPAICPTTTCYDSSDGAQEKMILSSRHRAITYWANVRIGKVVRRYDVPLHQLPRERKGRHQPEARAAPSLFPSTEDRRKRRKSCRWRHSGDIVLCRISAQQCRQNVA
jgi:hypothetical protein